jgi:hypothetical protein
MKGAPMTLAVESPTVSPAVAERLALGPHVFVDGKAEAPLRGETLPVLDPATARTIATAASGDAAAGSSPPRSPWGARSS